MGVEIYTAKLMEKGFVIVRDDYLLNNRFIVLNRSNDKNKSNFFIFLDFKNREVFFSHPTAKEGIVRKKFNELTDFHEKTLEISSLKKDNEYYAFLHSHLGYVWNGKKYEPLWGDGVSKDKEWILHTVLAHGDYKALTEHNWTQNEYRLGLLQERLEKFNITFIPGFENTTTLDKNNPIDLIQSPHILWYCKDIKTAMDVKDNFLRKKLIKDVDITPIYSGVPVSFDEQMSILNKYREEGKVFAVVAHPSSTLPGIDILDPKCIEFLGMDRILKTLWSLDGVEMYNSLEKHSNIEKELTKVKDYGEEVVKWIRNELKKRGLNEYLSTSMINYLIGRMAVEKGVNTIFGQDDHHLPNVDGTTKSVYLYGHTKIFHEKKLDSREFVESVLHKKIKLEAHFYGTITNKGPVIYKERKEGLKEKIVGLFDKVKYYLNLGYNTIRFYAAKLLNNVELIDEIKKEMERYKNVK